MIPSSYTMNFASLNMASYQHNRQSDLYTNYKYRDGHSACIASLCTKRLRPVLTVVVLYNCRMYGLSHK